MATSETTGPNGYVADYANRITLSRALVAGVVGGVAFGIPLQFLVGRMEAIGALYNFGEPSLAIGWGAHLVHSAVFGVVFGMVSEYPPIHRMMDDNVGIAAVVGIGFGMALWAVNMTLLWPAWLGAVGFPPAADWSIPRIAFRPLAGHVLYGVITGTVFYFLVDY